jgi:hypothetical protein
VLGLTLVVCLLGAVCAIYMAAVEEYFHAVVTGVACGVIGLCVLYAVGPHQPSVSSVELLRSPGERVQRAVLEARLQAYESNAALQSRLRECWSIGPNGVLSVPPPLAERMHRDRLEREHAENAPTLRHVRAPMPYPLESASDYPSDAITLPNLLVPGGDV